MNNLTEKLHALANRWKKMAMAQVPPEYDSRDMHQKYLKLDNEAAGLDNCAEELQELLSIEATQPTGEADLAFSVGVEDCLVCGAGYCICDEKEKSPK